MALQDKAILVSLNTSLWVGRKYDKVATQQTLADNNAKRDAGKFYKDLMAGNNQSLRAVFNAAMAARMDHLKLTNPWYNDGTRILPSAMYFDYTEKMRQHNAAFDTYKDFFVTDYEQHYNDMALLEQALGKMFARNDYPSPTIMKQKFRFAIVMSPIPNGGDWRCNIAEDEYKVSNLIPDIEKAAIQDAFQRIKKLLVDDENPDAGFIGKLANYTGDKKGSFRDSLFEKLEELCDILPKLNITDDPNLTQTVKEIKDKILVYTPDQVRDSVYDRAMAMTNAQAILDNMKGYTG